ncbi:MAG: M42 family metallopeptidase [Clostridiales bacterium]
MILEELSNLSGISGDEKDIRDYIMEKIKNYVDNIRIDSIGNLIALKKGKNSDLKLMLAAHMDEVGFIVKSINDDGTIKFATIGGFDNRILPGKKIFIGKEKKPGVIGILPIHLQSSARKKRVFSLNELYIDIGSDSKERTEKIIDIGDYISFKGNFKRLGQNYYMSKALDDRVGCSILIDIILQTELLDFDLVICFTVQEEVGTRGAEVIAYSEEPDAAIVVEGTTASDVPDVKDSMTSTKLAAGPVLTIMDRASYSNKNLVRFINQIAESKNIKIQYKNTVTGGNDAGKIQRSRNGVKTAVISVPVRYIHSPTSVIYEKDYINTNKLVFEVIREFSFNKI